VALKRLSADLLGAVRTLFIRRRRRELLMTPRCCNETAGHGSSMVACTRRSMTRIWPVFGAERTSTSRQRRYGSFSLRARYRMYATRLPPLGNNALMGPGETISSVMELEHAALVARGSDPNVSNKRSQRNGANPVK